MQTGDSPTHPVRDGLRPARSLPKLLYHRHLRSSPDATHCITAQYLALVAGRTIPCVWNVFTAGLLQTHIFTVRVLLANGCMRVSLHGLRCMLAHGYMRSYLPMRPWPCVLPQQCRCLDRASDVLVLLAAGYEHSGDIGFVKGAVPLGILHLLTFTRSCHLARQCESGMNVARAGVQVVEPVWGSKEYIKYLVLVNTASGVSTFFVIYLAYAMDRNNEGNLLCAPSFNICLQVVIAVRCPFWTYSIMTCYLHE